MRRRAGLVTLSIVVAACGAPRAVNPRQATARTNGKAVASPKVATPAETVGSLNAALTRNDRESVRTLCTLDFWAQSSDGGIAMFEQATRKQFQFRVQEVEVKEADGRAVARASVIKENARAVDEVYVYFKHTDGKWLVDGLNENESMAALFLSGGVDTRLDIGFLPASEETNQLVQVLLQDRAMFLASGDSHAAAVVAEIEKLKAPHVSSAHFHKGLMRSAVELRDGDAGDVLWVYAVHEAKGPRLVGWSRGYPSVAVFLSQH